MSRKSSWQLKLKHASVRKVQQMSMKLFTSNEMLKVSHKRPPRASAFSDKRIVENNKMEEMKSENVQVIGDLEGIKDGATIKRLG